MKRFVLISFLILSSKLMANENRLINVEGTVEKSFRPDMISFNINIWAKGKNAREALKLQVEEADKFKKNLVNFKIDPKDVMTIGFDVNPNYVWDSKTNQNTINGYQVNENLSITLKNVDDAGKFLDEATFGEKLSGVTIGSMNWDIKNRDEVSKSLLTDAVKIAQDKAELLAKAANIKIKRIFSITPAQNQVNIPMMSNIHMMSDSMEKSSAPSLQSGQVKVSSSVNMQFEIE